jgi:hypothetical protein
MGDRYIEVVEAYRVDTVVRKRPYRQAMPSHRTVTIGSKSGTSIPRLPHFQGFIDQEGKGRGGHTCSLHEKDTTKTWASGGDIDSIPLDTYREREHASEERSLNGAAPNQEAPALGVSPRRARECECLPGPGPIEAIQHHHQLHSICRLLPHYEPWVSNISDINSPSPR